MSMPLVKITNEEPTEYQSAKANQICLSMQPRCIRSHWPFTDWLIISPSMVNFRRRC